MPPDQLGQPDRPIEELPAARRLGAEVLAMTPPQLLQQEVWLGAELREHCALCRQWTTKHGGTKIHMQAYHSAEWQQAAELAKAKCLQYQDMVNHVTGCGFCGAPKLRIDTLPRRTHRIVRYCSRLCSFKLCRRRRQALALVCVAAIFRPLAGKVIELRAAPDGTDLTPEQRQYLAKHCVFCKQYLPDPKSLKQHLKRKHPHVNVTEAALKPNCKLMTQIRQGRCYNCDRDVVATTSHVMNYVVVYQTCLARHLIDNGRAQDDLWAPLPGPGGDGRNVQSEQEAAARLSSAGPARQGPGQRATRQGEGQGKSAQLEPIME